VTNKLPAALTALITSETSKIKDMIENQNAALIGIIKESESLSKAEEVILEAKKIKDSLSSESTRNSNLAQEKILEVVAPLLNSTEIREELSNKTAILDFLAPLLASLKKEDVTEKPPEKIANKTIEQKVLEAVIPFLQDEEQDANQKRNILKLVSSLVSSTEKSLEISEVNVRNETFRSEKENRPGNKTEDVEKEELLKAQLSGQKSIVQALLKLTNITKTLLEEKEASKNAQPTKKEEEEEKSTEIDDDSDEEQKEEVRSSGKGKSVREKEKEKNKENLSSDYDYDFDDELDDNRGHKRQKSLVERIATGSSATRNLKGNQALFEEFVKLAIERQRWEQAKQVHTIIQSTLTTLPPSKSKHKGDSEEILLESAEDIDEEPRSSDSNKHSSKKKMQVETEDDSDADKVKEKAKATEKTIIKTTTTTTTTKPPKKTQKPTTPTTTTTTTPEPELQETEEEYESEDPEIEEVEDSIAEEIQEEQPKNENTGADTIDNSKLQNSRTSLVNRINSRNQPVITVRPTKPTPPVENRANSANKNGISVSKPRIDIAANENDISHIKFLPTAKTTEQTVLKHESESQENTADKHHDDQEESNVIKHTRNESSEHIHPEISINRDSNSVDLKEIPEPESKNIVAEGEVSGNEKNETSRPELDQSSTSKDVILSTTQAPSSVSSVPRQAIAGSRLLAPNNSNQERDSPENQPTHFNGPGRGRGFFRPRTTTLSSIGIVPSTTSLSRETERSTIQSVVTGKTEAVAKVPEEISTASTTSDPLKLLQILVDHRVKNQPGDVSNLEISDQGTEQIFLLISLS
jgi:hypothetical protein